MLIWSPRKRPFYLGRAGGLNYNFELQTAYLTIITNEEFVSWFHRVYYILERVQHGGHSDDEMCTWVIRGGTPTHLVLNVYYIVFLRIKKNGKTEAVWLLQYSTRNLLFIFSSAVGVPPPKWWKKTSLEGGSHAEMCEKLFDKSKDCSPYSLFESIRKFSLRRVIPYLGVQECLAAPKLMTLCFLKKYKWSLTTKMRNSTMKKNPSWTVKHMVYRRRKVHSNIQGTPCPKSCRVFLICLAVFLVLGSYTFAAQGRNAQKREAYGRTKLFGPLDRVGRCFFAPIFWS